MTLASRDAMYARSPVPGWLRDVVRMVITFHLVCFAWIFFRADTLEASMQVVTGFVTGDWGMPFLPKRTLLNGAIGLSLLCAVELVQYCSRDARALFLAIPAPLRLVGWTLLLFLIILLGVEEGAQFIYFQF